MGPMEGGISADENNAVTGNKRNRNRIPGACERILFFHRRLAIWGRRVGDHL